MSYGYRDQVVDLLEKYSLGSPKIDERMMDWLRLFYMYSRLDLEKERDNLGAALEEVNADRLQQIDIKTTFMRELSHCEEDKDRLAAELETATAKIERLEWENKGIAEWRDEAMRLTDLTKSLADENAELVRALQWIATQPASGDIQCRASAALAKVKESGK